MKGKSGRIVLIYIALSITWIFLSDSLVNLIALITSSRPETIQTGKGVTFVFITAGLLYMLISRQHKTLLNNAKQYKTLFSSNPNPLWVYDRDTLKFVAVNQAAINVYGYSEEEFQNMTILDIRPVEDKTKLTDFLKKITEDFNFSDNWKHITKSGKLIFVNISSHRIEFNGLDCSLVMAQDVTQKLIHQEELNRAYQIEKELRTELEQNVALLCQSLESRRQLTEVVDRINNMVIITDPSGIITWVNPAFENFTGFSLKEVINKTPEFLHGSKTDPKIHEMIMQSISENGFGTFEILNYTKTGKEYWVEISISAIRDDNAHVVRYISIQNIITERKLREQSISEKNTVLRRHAWTISHAVRRPVASIISLLALSKDAHDVKEIRELHSMIERSALELDEIVTKINKDINDCEHDPKV